MVKANNIKNKERLVTVKVREDDALLIKRVVALANVKTVDVVKLWPQCPQCGFPIVKITKKIFCLNCGAEFKLERI
jgi:ribosomal protein S27AE